MTELEYLRELARLQQRRIEQLETELAEVGEVVKQPAKNIRIDFPTAPSFPDPRIYSRWQY